MGDGVTAGAGTGAHAGTGTAAGVVACPGCGKRNRVPAEAAGTPRCAQCQAALPWIAEADDATFAAVGDRSPVPVLVDLWAPWCPPCRAVAPVLERLAVQMAGRLKLVKVNVDDARRLAQRFDARSIPTLVLLDGGEVVDRRSGAAPEPTLRSWVEGSLRST